MLQIPPYGKALYALQKSGQYPKNSINVWAGAFAWRKAQLFTASCPARTLILPPWENPENYYWPVNKCDVLINNTSPCEDDYIEDLVYELYKGGAEIVRYLSPCLELTVFHQQLRSVSHAR